MNEETGKKLSRRGLMNIAATVGGIGIASAVGGCRQIGDTKLGRRFLPLRRNENENRQTALVPTHADLPTVRLLNRVAYGQTSEEIAYIEKIGRTAYIDEQLNAPGDDSREPLGLKMRLNSIEAYHYSAYELRDLKDDEVLRQLQQAAILRAVYSPFQLRERMADFWTNHFNIYGRKAYGAYMLPEADRDVIRKHALGNFHEMLRASARSPAMLAYLDNKLNRRGVANENYAREIMELHTLGVAGTGKSRKNGTGGYTQKDVQEVARCLTGWTIEEGFLKKRGTFHFDPTKHDDGEKIVLGQKIGAGGGIEDGERVLDILSTHPHTAQFISGKMVRHFLGHDDQTWTNRLADIYLKTHGDIKAMLRPLLLSDDLLQTPPILKRPFNYLVSALRATDADTDGGKEVQRYLAAMGQPLFQWPMPDGYPDGTRAWTGTLLHRWNFALALANDQITGTRTNLTVDKNDSRQLIAHLTGIGDYQSATVNTLHELSQKHTYHETLALTLAAPVFQWS